MAGPTIRFLGRVSDEELTKYYARCRGLIFPGEEDFGIAPLEANASGRPVVAYRAGGALDTVTDGETGVHFRDQTVASLLEAVARCDALTWVPNQLRRHAERFSSDVFKDRIERIVERELMATGRATTLAS
jgi:glycosyltransferase involved in cell wall biosynthesis